MTKAHQLLESAYQRSLAGESVPFFDVYYREMAAREDEWIARGNARALLDNAIYKVYGPSLFYMGFDGTELSPAERAVIYGMAAKQGRAFFW